MEEEKVKGGHTVPLEDQGEGGRDRKQERQCGLLWAVLATISGLGGMESGKNCVVFCNIDEDIPLSERDNENLVF